MDSRQLIVKSNDLINASYKLSLDEQRLILACISQIDSRDDLTKKDCFKLSVGDFYRDFNLKSKESAYKQLKNVVSTLYERSILIKKDSCKKKYITARWVHAVSYDYDDASVELYFSPNVIPFLANLQSNFTSYKLKYVAKMTSIYAIRFYELINQWRNANRKEVEFSVGELKKTLGIKDGEYGRSNDFKRKVLEIAKKQINEFSDFNIDFSYQKKGHLRGVKILFEKKEHLEKKVSAQKTARKLKEICENLDEIENREYKKKESMRQLELYEFKTPDCMKMQ